MLPCCVLAFVVGRGWWWVLMLALALVCVAWLCAPVRRWWWVLAPLMFAACGGWWWVLVLTLIDVASLRTPIGGGSLDPFVLPRWVLVSAIGGDGARMDDKRRWIVAIRRFVATSLIATWHLKGVWKRKDGGDGVLMYCGRRQRQALSPSDDNTWSSLRRLGLVVDGGGGERTLWIVDRTQIEHRRLLTFALGVTNPQRD